MEIRIPEIGESVFEALIARWLKQDGDKVSRDEPLCEIETDKITLEINADHDGILRVKVPAGTTVKVGSIIGTLEETVSGGPKEVAEQPRQGQRVSPSARKQSRESGTAAVTGKAADEAVQAVKETPPLEIRSEEPVPYGPTTPTAPDGRITRVAMSPIRKKIAERLLAARRETAMLTSFNEADMGRIKELIGRFGEEFKRKHGLKLGFMPFFVKACCEALREFPAVNASIDGDDLVYHNYYDIGIAVSGEKGLVVPVLRDADRLRFGEIEQAITGFVEKIRTNRLTIAELQGGTFTITNGGVFGSLMSTPILNPPQSGVLGMHAIQERPVARNGEVVIRPMMYLALSYDHRIIDGREAVLFLRKVKEYIEEPEEMLLES